ncbi:hypothetical protein IQ249_23540 [Lusitaniella coriacea LEGE 07157]|uniref:Restriction endonuclease n=1 Tax=Lusitaniella coriacea LEGE 07157 TaxID=945747 RepID=A0A8J7E070_9CYAN|nr:hypothetical protein [Lusitaniella coriacea]MBE9118867.1 hypothetical protein [Lusitaniella coriacea LEGE 07157]
MDWTTPLRSQQLDFVARLNSGHLLHCDLPNLHSELVILPKKIANTLQEQSNGDSNKLYEAAEKFAIEARLGNRITVAKPSVVDNRAVDFTLSANPSMSIRVKSTQGQLQDVHWLVSPEELEQNAAILCLLFLDPLDSEAAEYRVVWAGFIPTSMVEGSKNPVLFMLDNLLYIGGLSSYLESFKLSKKEKIEIQDTSSLSAWLPELEPQDLERGDRAAWKTRFIKWAQTIVLNASTESIRFYLYDLLNTQYYRQTLWKLYYKREKETFATARSKERDAIAKQLDEQAENIMFDLAGLNKNE